MTRFPPRPFWLSLAAHGAAAAVLALSLGSPATGPRLPERLLLLAAHEVEAEPEPERPVPVMPEVHPPASTEPLEEERREEAEDDRTPETAPVLAESSTRGGLIGLGPGGRRVPGRRILKPPPPPVEPPPPPPAAPAPACPSTRALPIPDSCPPPDYPARERRWGIEGVVELCVRVAADGSVESVEVAASSGSVLLDGAAAAAVRRWRFEPALRDGLRVSDVVLQTIRFRLAAAALAKEGR